MRTKLLALGGALICASAANAGLVITEVMSSSAGAGATNGDWWELTNTGPIAVTLTGYHWNDDTGGFSTSVSIFPVSSIGAGESILIVDENATDIAGWRTNWGLVPTIQTMSNAVMTGDNAFSGLGATIAGDQVNLWDSGGVLQASVTFGLATGGKSFEWDTAGNPLGLSVNGENGAYVSVNTLDTGSPGVAVPAPGALALLGCAGLLGASRKRRRA